MKSDLGLQALAATVLLSACSSGGVLIKSPMSNFADAQRVLLSVAHDQSLTVVNYARTSDPPNPLAYRPVVKVVGPTKATDNTDLVYSLEVSDSENRFALWIAHEQHAPPLCKALRGARVPFEVINGAERVPDCAHD